MRSENHGSSPRSIVTVVARYGRSEEYAREVNLKLNWAHFDPKALCATHAAERSDWFDRIALLEAEIARLALIADREHATRARCEQHERRAEELHALIRDLKSTSKLTRLQLRQTSRHTLARRRAAHAEGRDGHQSACGAVRGWASHQVENRDERSLSRVVLVPSAAA